jgi:hypothetical protein
METEPRQLELFDTASYAATPCHVDMTEGRQELPNVVGVNFTPQGLIVADVATMQPEEFNAIFRSVIRFAKASNWLLGDTLLLCERRWGVPQVQSKYAEAMAASDKITAMLPQIRATAESYPQLGTNSSFLKLMEDIRDCEDKIAYARNRYNMTVARFNMDIAMFPGKIVAGTHGFIPEQVFEITETARQDADNMRISQL